MYVLRLKYRSYYTITADNQCVTPSASENSGFAWANNSLKITENAGKEPWRIAVGTAPFTALEAPKQAYFSADFGTILIGS